MSYSEMAQLELMNAINSSCVTRISLITRMLLADGERLPHAKSVKSVYFPSVRYSPFPSHQNPLNPLQRLAGR